VTLFGEPDAPGATPVTPEDFEGLLPTWVATRADLNACEQANIEDAIRWGFARRSRRTASTVNELLTGEFSDRLHKKMFGDVWTWAGQRRRTMTNIGVDPHDIAVQLRLALDDAQFWHEHATFSPNELAARLHHRLVCVHPYPNGNGRQTRMMADLYLHLVHAPPFTWGGATLEAPTEARATYIASLKAATDGDISELLAFATL
jgi:Fic-DOC domain mobile mystery protein B